MKLTMQESSPTSGAVSFFSSSLLLSLFLVGLYRLELQGYVSVRVCLCASARGWLQVSMRGGFRGGWSKVRKPNINTTSIPTDPPISTLLHQLNIIVNHNPLLFTSLAKQHNPAFLDKNWNENYFSCLNTSLNPVCLITCLFKKKTMFPVKKSCTFFPLFSYFGKNERNAYCSEPFIKKLSKDFVCCVSAWSTGWTWLSATPNHNLFLFFCVCYSQLIVATILNQVC